MKKHILSVLVAAALCIAPTQAQNSDLLVVKRLPIWRGGFASVVFLDRGAGPDIQADYLGPQIYWSPLGNAPLVDFIEEPMFDPEVFPGGPMIHRVVFGPVTLRPGQPFVGIFGFLEPEAPGFSETMLRNNLMGHFEVEVDGVAVRAELLRFLSFDPGGGEWMTGFNYSQALHEPGVHRLIYRWTTDKEYCEGPVCLPGGQWIYDFTVVIEGGI